MKISYQPRHDYSIDEFVAHFDHFATSPEGTARNALIRYFAAHYSNRSEALYKLNRFGNAFAYLMRHLDEFEPFVVAGVVEGQKRALVSKPLVVALARYFRGMPDECLANISDGVFEPDPGMISGLAREAEPRLGEWA